MIFNSINKKSLLVFFALIMFNNMLVLSMDKSHELLLGNLVEIPLMEKAPLVRPSNEQAKNKRKHKKKKLKTFLERLYSSDHKGITVTTSDEEPGLTFDESDIHPNAFDPTKKILDYQAYVNNLKSLLAKKDILEYCNQLNRLANEIAELEPKQQLEKYFMFLFNNLDASTELINYFSVAITQIYSNYIKKYDKKKLFKARIRDHFTTFVFPLVPEETQKKLEVTLQHFLTIEQSTVVDEIIKKKDIENRFTDSSLPKVSLSQEEQIIWQSPIRLELPQDTACYFLHKRKKIISASENGDIFDTDLNQKKHKLISKKNNPNFTSIPYWIDIKKRKSKAYLNVLKAKPHLTPTFFLSAFNCYFVGKKSGKIIVQDDLAEIINKLLGHKDAISGLVALTDSSSQYLASCSHDTTIKIWNFKKEVCLQTLKSSIGQIQALATASPELLIGLVGQKFLEVWNVQDKRLSEKIKLIEIIYSPVLCIAGYNNYCLTGLSNGTILVWDPKKGHCIEEIDVEGKLPIKKLSSENSHIIATQENANKKILTLFMKKNQ